MRFARFVKVVLLALLALVAASEEMTAQRQYSPNLTVGGKGGITLSNMQFTPSVEQGMVTGKIFGVTARYTEENHFGVILEINFQQRGWKEKFEENPEFEYSRTLTYIQMPMLTHIYFGGRRFKGFVNLGPSIGYMIGSSISSNFDYMNPESVPGFPLTYRTTEQMKLKVSKKFDYGLTAGLGMELFINRRNSLVFEGRYYFGIGNIFPDRKRDYFSASRGTSIEVTLGYNFRIK